VTDLFPIAHSVLDAAALATALASRYAFDGPPVCQLMYRGMNDIYIVHDDERRYALRAWRANWRDVSHVVYETEFLQFLKGRGLPVANGIPARDGSLFFKVDVQEGVRPIALFEWAEGQKFGTAPNADVARRIGETFAHMHFAAREFKASVDRVTNPPSDLLDNVAPLMELVFDRPDDRRDYPRIAERLHRAMTDLATKNLPRGPNHGDFHFNNVHVTGDGRFTLLDFDNAGDDYFLQDLACYVWANEYGKYDPVYATAFLDGYRSVRAFTADESASLPLMIFAKEFRLLSGFSRHMNSVGHAPLRFRDLDWFGRSIRGRAATLGLF
jgi:Ser/Thr protein kinase RdoA (MazF antagonist)